MHDVRDGFMEWFRIDDCRRMDPDLRYELEILDDEIRSLVARMCAKTIETGGDGTRFSLATSTVLLSIAATLTKTVDHPHGPIDSDDFLARAYDAADWVNNRKVRQARMRQRPQMCL